MMSSLRLVLGSKMVSSLLLAFSESPRDVANSMNARSLVRTTLQLSPFDMSSRYPCLKRVFMASKPGWIVELNPKPAKLPC